MKIKAPFPIIFIIFFVNSCSEPIELNENPPTYSDGLIIGKVSNNPTLNQSSDFNIRLNSNPGKEVNFVVNLTEISDNSTVSPSLFSLNSSNWKTGKNITISGVCDDNFDNATASINFSSGDYSTKFVSVDSTLTDGNLLNLERSKDRYNNYIDDLSIEIQEAPSISVTKSQDFISEAGGASILSIQLCTEPNDNVTLSLSTSDSNEASLSTNSLVFSTGNWSTEQTVIVTGVDDSKIDGNQSFNIEISSSYLIESPKRIAMINHDNETRKIIVSKTNVTTSEGNGTDTFTVALSQQPSANVNITIKVYDTNLNLSSVEATVNPTSLTFTNSDYSTAQTVTVTGVDDNYDDGDQNYYIQLSGDGDFSSSLINEKITGTNADND
jgi:hypothetical protein